SDLGLVSRRPVHSFMRLQSPVECHMRSRADGANPAVDRVLGWPVYLTQVPIQPVAVDRQCCVRIGRDRLQFRTEYECAVEATVVKRLYAKSISHQAQCSLVD